MASIRCKQVADIIQKTVGQLLLRAVRDPRLADVRITEVRVSPDLAQATVYYTLLTPDEEVETSAALGRAAGFLRSELARATSLRRVPKLHFQYDKLLDSGSDLLNLINAAVASDLN